MARERRSYVSKGHDVSGFGRAHGRFVNIVYTSRRPDHYKYSCNKAREQNA